MALRGVSARGVYVVQDLDSSRRMEVDTHTCRHCQEILMVPVGAQADDVGGFCPHCQSVVCTACAKKATTARNAREACTPFAERVEASLRQYAQRQAMGL